MTERSGTNDLPKGWTRTTLREVGAWSGGGTPSKQNRAFWTDGSIPWVSPKDMKSDFITAAEDTVTEAAIEASAAKLIPPGSVLFVTRSGILRHTLPVAVTRVEVAVNQDLKALTPIEAVDPVYLLRYVQAYNQEILHACSKDGTTVQSIETERLHEYPVLLAPLDEQRRIVDKIEELFSDLDAGVKALETVRRQLDRYRQSVLKAAVEGDLTREWREQHGADIEPAEVLLERILEERRVRWEADTAAKYEAKGKKPPKGWQSRYKEPEAPETGNLPGLPRGWTWTSVNHILGKGLANGRSVRTQEGGFPVLRLTAIRDGRIDLNETKEGAWTEVEASPYVVREGDFLLARGNGSLDLVGRGGLVDSAPMKVAFPDTMIRIVPNVAYCHPAFLRLTWDSLFIRQQITSAARTTAGIYKVNQQHIESLILPLPPLAEQEAVVEEIEHRLSVVDAVAAEVEQQLIRARRLRRAILQHAFEGKLVPQAAGEKSDNPEPATFGKQLALHV